MRISQAGLKSSHPTTSFSLPPSNRRERQLGLRRGPQVQMTTHPGARGRVPLLAALRQAARSVTSADLAARPALAAPTAAPSRLRPSISITWSRPTGSGSGRPRPRSAAPWRG